MSRRGTTAAGRTLASDIQQALDLTHAAVAQDKALLQRVRSRVLSAIAQQAPQHITVRAGEGGWELVAPGVARKVLLQADGAVSSLVRLDPGARVGGHLHPIHEECLVLAGTLRIGRDLLLGPGDFHVGVAGIAHEEASTESGALVFLRGACEPAPRHHASA